MSASIETFVEENDLVSQKCWSKRLIWVLASLFVICGCVRDSYQFGLGPNVASDSGFQQAPLSNPVSVGGEHPRLDRVENVVQWPGKIVRKLFRRKEPTPQKIEADRLQSLELAEQYLQANELEDIQIDVRRYEPAEQWERIQQNPRVSPFWKATGGTLSWFRYSLLPGRVFHTNQFDPFSNTLSLNSTKPTRAIYETAVAKQYRRQPMLGTYAVLQYVPLLPIAHHAAATSDVLTYARVTDQESLEHELYPTAYAKLGSVTVAEALSLTPLSAGSPFYAGPLIRITGAATGNVIGRTQVKRIKQSDVLTLFPEE